MDEVAVFNTVLIQSTIDESSATASLWHDVEFMNCKIEGLDLQGAILSNIRFGTGTSISNIQLDGAYVLDEDWLSNQEGWDGAIELKETYRLGNPVSWERSGLNSPAVERLRAMRPDSQLYPIRTK